MLLELPLKVVDKSLKFSLLLTSKVEYNKMATAVNPYGDGLASKRIVNAIEEYFNK